jgi:hypothetical protein
MRFVRHIYQSKKAQDGEYGPHFNDQELIQTSLENLCKAWARYLQGHIEQTGRLFGEPAFPWLDNERAIVSTLSAAIVRGFRKSLVLEECRLKKPGRYSSQESNKSSDAGRCDLWASIPENEASCIPFSFYLEAKKSVTPKTSLTLSDYLNTDRGISRLFNDYLKSNPGKIRKRSPYQSLKDRIHPHYVIGMLVMPLKRTKSDLKDAALFAKIDDALSNVFEKGHAVKIKGSSEGSESERRRRLGRYPTVALILAPENDQTGMIATFTVFGATKEFL